MLQRHADRRLAEWFIRPRRKPLVVRGARQVGKSTLVRAFAQQRGLRLAELNLEQHADLERTWATLDPERILTELEGAMRAPIEDHDTLLFLDEIQATPSALPALRYLHERRPGLAIVAAGSLLEFVLKEHDFSMPVGRIEYLHLGPMLFSEFLWAVGERWLDEQLHGLSPGAELAQAAHERLLELQRLFLIVGGMPEAVAEYAASPASLTRVSEVQRTIVATYKDDFAKYAARSSLARLQRVFEYIPGAIGQKVKYAAIAPEDSARTTRQVLELLALARVITPVHHSDCSGIPLGAQKDFAVFKCLFLDVGLMNAILGLDPAAVRSFDERRLVNEGGLAEQFIGQHLLYRAGPIEPTLHYWLREGKANNAEVDYVISQADWIVPVEVKAGRSGSLRSLHEFVRAKAPPLVARLDLGQPSLANYEHMLTRDGVTSPVRFRMLSLPLYLVEQLDRLISEIREKG